MRLNSFHFHTVTKHLPLPSLYLLIEIQRSKSTYYKKKKKKSHAIEIKFKKFQEECICRIVTALAY